MIKPIIEFTNNHVVRISDIHTYIDVLINKYKMA